MADEAQGAMSPEQADDLTVYYRIVDGDAIGRLEDGWNRQVFNGTAWVDYDIDFGTEAHEIPADEALAETEAEGQGEFAPTAVPPAESAGDVGEFA